MDSRSLDFLGVQLPRYIQVAPELLLEVLDRNRKWQEQSIALVLNLHDANV